MEELSWLVYGLHRFFFRIPSTFRLHVLLKRDHLSNAFWVCVETLHFSSLKKKISKYSISLACLQFCPSVRVAKCPLTIWCTSFNQAQVPMKDWFRFLTQDFTGGKQHHIRGICFVRLITSVGMCISHNKHLCSALHFQITVKK